MGAKQFTPQLAGIFKHKIQLCNTYNGCYSLQYQSGGFVECIEISTPLVGAQFPFSEKVFPEHLSNHLKRGGFCAEAIRILEHRIIRNPSEWSLFAEGWDTIDASSGTVHNSALETEPHDVQIGMETTLSP